MAVDISKYQPGRILHDAIIGSFRANGDNFNAWIVRNGKNKAVCRNVTHGQTGGEMSKVLLAEIIEGAGVDTVDMIYAQRMQRHVDEWSAAIDDVVA